MGFGTSERRTDAIKVQFLLTEGFPTLPIGESKRMTPEDVALTINAARLSGKAGIKVHVFAARPKGDMSGYDYVVKNLTQQQETIYLYVTCAKVQ